MNLEKQVKIEGLTEDISADTFFDRWMDLICNDFKDFSAPDFNSAMAVLHNFLSEDQVENEFLSYHHLEILSNTCLLVNSGNKADITCLALDEFCSIVDESNYGKVSDVFDRIPNEQIAKEFLIYLSNFRSAHFQPYIEWLHENDVIDLNNFNPTERWKLASKTTSVNKPSNELVLVPKGPQINAQLAQRFPDLQDAINFIHKQPAFETALPIINQLVGQVVATGGLSRHLAILGPPGVGKTETVRLLHPILKALNVAGPQYYEYAPAKDAQKFIGHSERAMVKTIEQFKSNLGGVLLIDEAATLFESTNNPNASQNFRQRAVQPIHSQYKELLEANVVVIFAGYREGFERFLATDPGWARRVQLIDVQPPRVELLAQKIGSELRADSFEVPEKLEENIIWLFQELIEQDSMNFGYWATAHNFKEMLKGTCGGDIFSENFGMSTQIDIESFKEASRSIGFIGDVESRWIGPKRHAQFQSPDIPDTIEGIAWDR